MSVSGGLFDRCEGRAGLTRLTVKNKNQRLTPTPPRLTPAPPGDGSRGIVCVAFSSPLRRASPDFWNNPFRSRRRGHASVEKGVRNRYYASCRNGSWQLSCPRVVFSFTSDPDGLPGTSEPRSGSRIVPPSTIPQPATTPLSQRTSHALRVCGRFLMIQEGAGQSEGRLKGSAQPSPFLDQEERPLVSRYRRTGDNAPLPRESH
jgi:hypothetical protein